MPKSPISFSTITSFALAFGGTAIQVFEKLGPVTNPTDPSLWLAPLGVVAAALAGFGFNRLASAADKRKELQDATRELLTNRDIALAQAHAIAARLRRCAEDQEEALAYDAERLLAIAEAAAEWWQIAVSDPADAELAKLRDDQIIDEITPYLSGEDHLIIDKQAWKEILLVADKGTPGIARLSSSAIEKFAGHLEGSFTHDFVEVLKTGGKAYAAVSLRFFAEILSGVRETANSQKELVPLLKDLPNLYKQLEEALAKLRSSGLTPDLEPIVDAAEKRIVDEIAALRDEMREGFESAPVRVADELERRQLIKPVHEFKADISRILKYAPAELIGREDELKLLSEAWAKVQAEEKGRPRIITFVALGGEGKTSLVSKWIADAQDWPGCDAAFAWSFYSQGTRDQVAANSDLFLKEALNFFAEGDPKEEEIKAFAASNAGAFEKGQKLARMVGQRRYILILDGLEPLQHPSSSPAFPPGELKDQGVAKLLKDLAANNAGLCVVTTRIGLPDLKAFKDQSVLEIELKRLSREHGVDLLKKLGVKGSDRRTVLLKDGLGKNEKVNEFEKLVEDVKGHALTLNLLGSYLHSAHAGDIRKRDLIKLHDADASNERRHHAVHVMDAYVHWLCPTGFRAWLRRLFSQKERELQRDGKRSLAILSFLGLFDRPAVADCLQALWTGEVIHGLTEPLIGLSEAERNLILQRLEDAKLLTIQQDEATGLLVALDAHPLLREYFARRLRDGQPEAWRAAHRRLYEHLCASTQEGDQPTLEALQPLYQAVAHGCQAGLQQEACAGVYRDRILRGQENYSGGKLGAMGSDLGATACFFETPWSRVSPALTKEAQSWLLNEAAFTLRALGRLTEAIQPMPAALEMDVQQKNWAEAARSASNLSELELTLGEVAGAVGDAEQSVTYADRSGDWGQRMTKRATHADALHQAGRRAEAEARFREAEQMQAERQPAYPLLYSLQGFRYCDLLLAEAERASWNVEFGMRNAELAEACRAVSERAAQTLKWEEGMRGAPLLDFALHHLTLGRAALHAAILDSPDSALRIPHSELDSAVSGLHRAGTTHHIPRALLTRAWQRSLTGALTSAQAGPDSAQSDLDEALEIAERGPMKLFMADIHLYRARLFFREITYPWKSPDDDLAEARKLIEQCGYGRRKEELEDAEAVLKQHQSSQKS